MQFFVKLYCIFITQLLYIYYNKFTKKSSEDLNVSCKLNAKYFFLIFFVIYIFMFILVVLSYSQTLLESTVTGVCHVLLTRHTICVVHGVPVYPKCFKSLTNEVLFKTWCYLRMWLLMTVDSKTAHWLTDMWLFWTTV